MQFFPLFPSFNPPYASNYLINNPIEQETNQINSDHSLFTSETKNIHVTYNSHPKKHILLLNLTCIYNNLTKKKFLPANVLPNARGSTLAGRNFFILDYNFRMTSAQICDASNDASYMNLKRCIPCIYPGIK